MLFLWVKALHIIFIVTWFAALFYLPRLFVYHAMSTDEVSIVRFKIMERKLYWGIATPSAVLATLFGIWLICLNPGYYLHAGWMHVKLGFVGLLWVFHLLCNFYRKQFINRVNKHSDTFYRWFNEVPVIFLVAIVILVVVKP